MITFLTAVLPANGNYVLNIATQRVDGTKWHKNYNATTIAELAQKAQQLDAGPTQTVYYALASFTDNIDPDGKVRRTQEKATLFKTLAFDVDPTDSKKNVIYTTQRDMAAAAIGACDKIGLPHPVFVSSGYGLHCYYPLTVEISKTMWVRISTMLRDALIAAGMTLDVSKICEPAMVLRPVGTHNKKSAGTKEVKLLSKLEAFDPMELATILKKFAKPPSATATGKKGRTSAVMAAILDTEFPPADHKLIELRCHHISVIAQTGGNVDEPLWHKSIGIAKHCIDGRAVAHKWSEGYPGYTAAETDKKFDAWGMGPTTCKVFESLDKSPCDNCEHRGRISSPVQLGVPEVHAPVPVSATVTMMPVRNYQYNNGKILRTVGGESQHVSDYLIFPSNRYKDELTGKTVCLAEVKLPIEGWQTYELPMDTLSSVADFQGWLINHQIFVHSKTTLEEMRRFMLTYLQELQLATESDAMSSSFGWTDDTCTQFVWGGKIITKDDTKEVRLSNAASDFAPSLVPRGNRDAWTRATAMFDEPGMQLFGLVFLMSIGSPLMAGSGLKSVLVNMFSKNSGTGKTTTGLFANSMYGNPNKLMLTVQDTDNSVFKTMGVYGNLPVYVDEITKINHDKAGRLGQIVYFITQGREKRRMNREGGFQESVEWQSITTASSNDDMYALLGNQMTFEGESMRILQFTMPDTALFKAENGGEFGYKMSLFLAANYGLAAEDFIRGVLSLGGPKDVYGKARAKFATKFGFTFTGKERFWQAALVIAYATGTITNALGITKFNIDECIKAGLKEVQRLRTDLADDRLDCFDLLGQYVNEHAAKTTVYKKNVLTKNDGAVMAPYPHEAVARVEALCDHKNPFISGKLFINQVHFNSWCHDKGLDRKGLLMDLATHSVVVHKDRRISLMRGTDKTLPAVRVYELEMVHPRFVSIMQQSDLGMMPPAALTVVKGNADASR